MSVISRKPVLMIAYGDGSLTVSREPYSVCLAGSSLIHRVLSACYFKTVRLLLSMVHDNREPQFRVSVRDTTVAVTLKCFV